MPNWWRCWFIAAVNRRDRGGLIAVRSAPAHGRIHVADEDLALVGHVVKRIYLV
jgi:hypothetical protein